MERGKSEPRLNLRPTAAELAELRRRARVKEKTLSRYLIKRGLSDVETEGAADPRELELKERAVFELRRAGHNLDRIAERVTGESVNVSRPQIEDAIKEMVAAARTLGAGFEEQGGR